jgi:acetyltransferase-like isoleucine patch superfamily enzyme
MNRRKRLFYWFVLLILPGRRRTEFIRKHHIYGSVGEKCSIQKRKVPLYSNLIFLHNNVHIASNVGFVTHDIIHKMLNNRPDGGKFVEKIGCIEIMNNVFIGSSTQIKYNIRIGNNVIIGANSFVTKDIPDNSVFAGVPARYVCSFDEYVEKHKAYSERFRAKFGRDKVCGVDDELAGMLYEDFLKEKNK